MSRFIVPKVLCIRGVKTDNPGHEDECYICLYKNRCRSEPRPGMVEAK